MYLKIIHKPSVGNKPDNDDKQGAKKGNGIRRKFATMGIEELLDNYSTLDKQACRANIYDMGGRPDPHRGPRRAGWP